MVTLSILGLNWCQHAGWKIVLYVRALQRAQNASLDDVPADRRADVTR